MGGNICREYIKTDLKEAEWKCVDWIYLAQDRDEWCASVNTVMNLHVLSYLSN
jgi:hypothetical protein